MKRGKEESNLMHSGGEYRCEEIRILKQHEKVYITSLGILDIQCNVSTGINVDALMEQWHWLEGTFAQRNTCVRCSACITLPATQNPLHDQARYYPRADHIRIDRRTAVEVSKDTSLQHSVA
eukprot:scaffold13213_cov117-Skeletonema_dohrnii-CCMP3373.AAC.2